MRRIINFGLTFATLYFANQFFPTNIVIKDINTVLLATVILFALSWIAGWSTMLSGLLMPVGVGCLTMVPSLFVLFFSQPIALWLMNKYLDGFYINGKLTFLLLWIVLGIFSINVKTTTTEK